MTVLTARFYARPRRHSVAADELADVDIVAVLDGLSWRADDWYGLKDVAADPTVTLERGAGDCADAARLVTSHLLAATDRPVSLYLVVNRPGWPPGHAIVSDGERTYSHSGREAEAVREQSVAAYLKRTDRLLAVERHLRGRAGPRVVRL